MFPQTRTRTESRRCTINPNQLPSSAVLSLLLTSLTPFPLSVARCKQTCFSGCVWLLSKHHPSHLPPPHSSRVLRGVEGNIHSRSPSQTPAGGALSWQVQRGGTLPTPTSLGSLQNHPEEKRFNQKQKFSVKWFKKSKHPSWEF